MYNYGLRSANSILKSSMKFLICGHHRTIITTYIPHQNVEDDYIKSLSGILKFLRNGAIRYNDKDTLAIYLAPSHYIQLPGDEAHITIFRRIPLPTRIQAFHFGEHGSFIRVIMPGLHPTDVEVTINKNIIKIYGDRYPSHPEIEEGLFSYQSLICLPYSIDKKDDDLEMRMNRGVLNIFLNTKNDIYEPKGVPTVFKEFKKIETSLQDEYEEQKAKRRSWFSQIPLVEHLRDFTFGAIYGFGNQAIKATVNVNILSAPYWTIRELPRVQHIGDHELYPVMIIRVLMPGLDESDVRVNVYDSVAEIWGVRSSKLPIEEDGGCNYFCRVALYYKYDDLEIRMSRGVLKIVLKKIEDSTRKLDIIHAFY